MKQALLHGILVLAPGVLCSGCFSPFQKVDERTALEQQLTTVAIRRAVEALEYEALTLPPRVRLRINAPEEADVDIVRTELQVALAAAGAIVRPDPREHFPVIEAKVEMAGSDITSTLMGIPLAFTATGLPIADLSLYKKETQYGRARLELHLFGPEGEWLGRTPCATGTAYRTGHTFLTYLGPFISTDLEE